MTNTNRLVVCALAVGAAVAANASLIGARCMANYAVSEPLPYDYQVEWIDARGTGAFFNTGFAPAQDDLIVEIKIQRDSDAGNDCMIMGIYRTGNCWLDFNAYGRFGLFARYLGISREEYNMPKEVVPSDWSVPHIIRWGYSFATIDDITFGAGAPMPVGTFVGNSNILTLLGRASNASGTSIMSAQYNLARWYYCKLWYGETLIRHYIFVVKDGEPMMYDTVTGTLFSNAGVGSFIVGPAVN